jgi:hypothetical protein
MKTIRDYTDNETHIAWFEELFLNDLEKTLDEITVEELKTEIRRTVTATDKTPIDEEYIYSNPDIYDMPSYIYGKHNYADIEEYIDVLQVIITDKEATK